MICFRADALGALFALALAPTVAWAAGPAESLSVSHGWAPAPAKVGADTSLYMTITNTGDAADGLLRIRCPFALFATKVTVDQGEGAPSAREVKAIPIPAGQTLTMTPDNWHVQLLQSTEAVQPGQTVACTLTFEKAGSRPLDVTIVPAGAKAAP
jgi:copper(I)-binding protein